ncbi:hypothetical protein DF185_05200 [Marinifilum breve]|uniref:DoxX-like family protein n=1 Tax=Marinifilum breve TaxID=2184082 RepID=A0A2V4A0K6_9BACT|nr:DoxX family protein [Marinifilum breve]PXY02043.1 hypothetical protein DF185_05200 [Marinifilum breve]
MNQKRNKIVYFGATGILSVLMLLSVSMYFLQNETISQAFEALGFPTYLVYPLAIAKILGLVAIWTKMSNMLKEWAYAGFLFVFTLALSAHVVAKDGQFVAPILAIVLLGVSYFFNNKLQLK